MSAASVARRPRAGSARASRSGLLVLVLLPLLLMPLAAVFVFAFRGGSGRLLAGAHLAATRSSRCASAC